MDEHYFILAALGILCVTAVLLYWLSERDDGPEPLPDSIRYPEKNQTKKHK